MTFQKAGRKVIQRKWATESKLFISYRRDDTEGQAGRLYDRLNAAFPGRVFRDVSGIDVGVDFAAAIQQAIADSAVLVAVIGKQWSNIAGPGGERRIVQPGDYVRLEIATGLARKLPIYPVLVDGAQMPSAQELPDDIKALSGINAIVLTPFDYDHLVESLIAAAKKLLGQTEPRPERESIEKLLARAETSIAAENWMSAKQALQSALSLDPNNSAAAGRLRFTQDNMRWLGLYTDARQRLAAGDRPGALTALNQIRASAGPYKDVDQLIVRLGWELPQSQPKRQSWKKWAVAAFVGIGLAGFAVDQADKNKPMPLVQPGSTPSVNAGFEPVGQWLLFTDDGAPGLQMQLNFVGNAASGQFTMVYPSNFYQGTYLYNQATKELTLSGTRTPNIPFWEQLHILDWKDNHFHVSLQTDSRRWAVRRLA